VVLADEGGAAAIDEGSHCDHEHQHGVSAPASTAGD
jgi:hypothetical protein